MAEYQRIEYRIAPDGQIVETVLNATGDRCLATTSDIEKALGTVASQELLPDYYASDEADLEHNLDTLKTSS
jgi:hypothetical protein